MNDKEKETEWSHLENGNGGGFLLGILFASTFWCLVFLVLWVSS
jgi:hypothetical protein